jgi:hypothetical protein
MVFGKLVLAAACGVIFASAAGLRADVLKFKNGDQVRGTFVKKEGGRILFRSERFGDLSAPEADATVELTAPPAPLVTETEVALAVGDSTHPPDAQKPAAAAKPPAPTPAAAPAAVAAGKPAAPATTASAATAASAAPKATASAATASATPKTAASASAAPKAAASAASASAASKAAAPAPAPAKPPPASITRLGKGFLKWWAGWHGRIAFSASIIHDTASRSLYTVEVRVKRTWKHDELQLEPRYEFREDNNVTAVDIFRASGYWRHTFGADWFVEYRPHYQRDRKSSKAEQLEQQFGVGRHILKSKQYRLHTGVAANMFNTWPLDRSLPETEYSQESLFSEASLNLPWRVTVTDRGSWYFLGNGSGAMGWQNTFELTKKLTDSLSFSLRHEVRQDNPDPRVSDYENTRFLLGYNF